MTLDGSWLTTSKDALKFDVCSEKLSSTFAAISELGNSFPIGASLDSVLGSALSEAMWCVQ